MSVGQFKECDEVTYLSGKVGASFHSARKTFIMDLESSDTLTVYAKLHNISMFTLFMAGLAVYMNRVKMNIDKFYIGTAVLNRIGVYDKSTAGMFVNSVPILIRLDNKAPFVENLLKVQEASFSMLRHQKYHYSDILADLRKEYDFTEKLYDVVLSYQNAEIEGFGDDCESTWYHNGMQMESLQIHIDNRDKKGVFRIQYDYQTEKFAKNEIEQMHDQIIALLLDAVAHDGKKIYELEIFSASERERIVYDFNDTAIEYPKAKCVHQLFEAQAARIPDKTAVIARDRILTYGELNEQANRLAYYLIAQKIGIGDIVAFILPRQSYLLSTILGILKTGAAYLPIDIDLPQERITYMLEDSNAKLCITTEMVKKILGEELPDSQSEISRSQISQSVRGMGNTETCKRENPSVVMTSDNICYCIYTSGSTGNPKGVLICHRNLVNLCSVNEKNSYQTAAISQDKILLSTAKCCFDAFAIDYALFLLNGNTFVLADDSDLTNSAKLAKLAEAYKVEVLQSTPSAIRALCTNEAYRKMLGQIKVLILAAEKFTPGLYGFLRKVTNADIYNGYGPSETTVGAVIGKMNSEDIHIGKPIANTQIYIVDQFMRPVPIGITGELCVAGAGVGAGYLNRLELTAEKFVENPFGAGTIYKTGDLAYWREDGTIAYVGRNDFQVKIRGLRIELEEIESAICAVKGVMHAGVVYRGTRMEGLLFARFTQKACLYRKNKSKYILVKSFQNI